MIKVKILWSDWPHYCKRALVHCLQAYGTCYPRLIFSFQFSPVVPLQKSTTLTRPSSLPLPICSQHGILSSFRTKLLLKYEKNYMKSIVSFVYSCWRIRIIGDRIRWQTWWGSHKTKEIWEHRFKHQAQCFNLSTDNQKLPREEREATSTASGVRTT